MGLGHTHRYLHRLKSLLLLMLMAEVSRWWEGNWNGGMTGKWAENSRHRQTFHELSRPLLPTRAVMPSTDCSVEIGKCLILNSRLSDV